MRAITEFIIERVIPVAVFTVILLLFIGSVLEEVLDKKLRCIPQGDMNHDGQLTIVDLSILAEVIRNQ